MEAFSGYIKEEFSSNSTNHTDIFPPSCGNSNLEHSEYVRLKYCGKNFNDVLKSFNLLFDLTVVNQWHGILFIEYFISFLLTSFYVFIHDGSP